MTTIKIQKNSAKFHTYSKRRTSHKRKCTTDNQNFQRYPQKINIKIHIKSIQDSKCLNTTRRHQVSLPHNSLQENKLIKIEEDIPRTLKFHINNIQESKNHNNYQNLRKLFKKIYLHFKRRNTNNIQDMIQNSSLQVQ